MKTEAPDAIPDYYALARPCNRAAALVFTALEVLGQYPEGAPDYDATAVEHLRLALSLLAPNFGDLTILGAPQLDRSKIRSDLTILDDLLVEAPPAAPAWVAEVLATADAT